MVGLIARSTLPPALSVWFVNSWKIE